MVFDRNLNLFVEQDKLCSCCGVRWCQPGITPESTIWEETRQFTDDFLDLLIDPQNPNFDVKRIEKKKKGKKKKKDDTKEKKKIKA